MLSTFKITENQVFNLQLTEGQLVRLIAGLHFVNFSQDEKRDDLVPTESVRDVYEQAQEQYIRHLTTDQ